MPKDMTVFMPDTRTEPPSRSAARKRLGPRPEVVLKPEPVALTDTASAHDAISAVLGAARRHWTVNLAAACDGRDIEGVHQVRVGFRRFRSALALFKKFLPESQRQWLNDEAHWILNELGSVRDLDVFTHELMQPLKPDQADRDFHALLRAAHGARRLAQERASVALQSKRYARFMQRLDAWLSGKGWLLADDGRTKDPKSVAAPLFAVRALNKRLIKILAYGKRVDQLPVADLHALRIDVKKARYGVEFFHAVLPKRRAQKLAGALKDMQDSLGRLNDLAVAEEIVSQLKAAATQTRHGSRVAQTGDAVVAYHRRSADDAVHGVAPRWRALRKCGLL